MSWNYMKNILKMPQWERQRGKCCYCGNKMDIGNGPNARRAATREHLKRKAEGGKSTADNIALACLECNTMRGSIPWNVYKSLRNGEFREIGEGILW